MKLLENLSKSSIITATYAIKIDDRTYNVKLMNSIKDICPLITSAFETAPILKNKTTIYYNDKYLEIANDNLQVYQKNLIRNYYENNCLVKYSTIAKCNLIEFPSCKKYNNLEHSEYLEWRLSEGCKIKLYKNQNSEYSILIMEIPTPELSKISEKRKNTIHNLFSTYQNIIKTISVL
jgi:hypothetical protein